MDKKDNRYYGEFGGQYVSESLMNTLDELEKAFDEAIKDPEFIKQYNYYLKEYVGRETPLYYAERLSEKYGPKIYLKREDLNHTGAHKINNVIGQILLAKRMGKTKVIAETGAGQHGVATATGAALFNMECTVFMGAEDIERQKLNVFRMEMLGAKVQPVTSGSSTLKDATNEAIRTWAERAEDTFYIIGSAVGPHPYPKMVKEFQRVISKEARKQILEKEGRLPDVVMACVGGGSNSIGMFADFIDDKDVKLVGVEAGGLGIETGKHASAMALGEVGILHGMKTYLLQDKDGNIELAHSISAGLVGFNDGTVSNSGIVLGQISSYNLSGGLVAYNGEHGTISNVYNRADVRVVNSETSVSIKYAGGITAVNLGNIFRAYNSGSVSGTSDISGVAGISASNMAESSADAQAGVNMVLLTHIQIMEQ